METKIPMSSIDYCVMDITEGEVPIQLYCIHDIEKKDGNFEVGVERSGILCCLSSERCDSAYCAHKRDLKKLA